MPKQYRVSLPPDDVLESPSGWQAKKGVMSACRFHFVVVETRENVARSGPVVNFVTLPVDADVDEELEYTVVSEIGEEFETSLQSALSKTVRNAWKNTHGLRADLGLTNGVPTPSGQLTDQTETSLATELIESVTEWSREKRSYRLVQTTRERSLVKSKVPKAGHEMQDVTYHLNVFAVHRDVYLMAVDVYAFEYTGLPSFGVLRGRQQRESTRIPMNLPLCRVTAFEPQRRIAHRFGAYAPAVPDAAELQVTTAPAECPTFRAPDARDALAEFAALAFPAGLRESRAAMVHRGKAKKARKAAKKGGRKAAKKGGWTVAGNSDGGSYRTTSAKKGTARSAAKKSARKIAKKSSVRSTRKSSARSAKKATRKSARKVSRSSTKRRGPRG